MKLCGTKAALLSAGGLAETLPFSARCSNSTPAPSQSQNKAWENTLLLWLQRCVLTLQGSSGLAVPQMKPREEGGGRWDSRLFVHALQLLSRRTLWLSCEEHHRAQRLVGGCLEVQWKLFVEHVMNYVCTWFTQRLAELGVSGSCNLLLVSFGFFSNTGEHLPCQIETPGFILPFSTLSIKLR